MKKFYAYLPVNLDLDAILPSSLAKYKDDASYLVHLIVKRQNYHKFKNNEKVELKAELLRKVMNWRNYHKIRDVLIEKQVIVCDLRYIKGIKSYSYALGPEFLKIGKKKLLGKRVSVKLNKFIEDHKKRVKPKTLAEEHLLKNLNKIYLPDNIFEKTDNDLYDQMCLDQISQREFFFKSDIHGRVHSNISNLSKSLRKHLLVDNKTIIELDIQNSQPFFLAILLLNNFSYSLDSSKNVNSFFIKTSPLPSSNTMCKTNVYRRFLAKVVDGRLYSYLKIISGNENYAGDFKKKVFKEILFGKNYYKTDLTESFSIEFPEVWETIQKVKEKDYRILSKLLMRVESYFVLEKIVGTFIKKYPEEFISTIHDSFLIHEHNIANLQEIINTQFSFYGIKPSCKVVQHG